MNRPGSIDYNAVQKLYLFPQEFEKLKHGLHRRDFSAWVQHQFCLQSGRTYHVHVDGEPTDITFKSAPS